MSASLLALRVALTLYRRIAEKTQILTVQCPYSSNSSSTRYSDWKPQWKIFPEACVNNIWVSIGRDKCSFWEGLNKVTSSWWVPCSTRLCSCKYRSKTEARNFVTECLLHARHTASTNTLHGLLHILSGKRKVSNTERVHTAPSKYLLIFMCIFVCLREYMCALCM